MESLFQDLTPRSDQALPLNTELNGRYKVGRVLRQSGGGFTYLSQNAVGDVVVIQEFFPKHLVTRTLGEGFVRPLTGQAVFDLTHGLELMLQAGEKFRQVTHPAVAPVFETFSENSTAYIVSAFHEGETLEDRIIQYGGRLSEKVALESALLALTGLKALHDQQVVHRGIKPEQLFYQGNNTVKLVNDGFYDLILPNPHATTGYDAPELFQPGLTEGAWTDLYSFGGVLYTALTGQQPAPASERIPVDGLIPPRQLNPNISEAMEMVILKLLAPNPTERFQSVGEFAKVLQPIYKAVIMGNVPPRPTLLPLSVSNVFIPVTPPKRAGKPDAMAHAASPDAAAFRDETLASALMASRTAMVANAADVAAKPISEPPPIPPPELPPIPAPPLSNSGTITTADLGGRLFPTDESPFFVPAVPPDAAVQSVPVPITARPKARRKSRMPLVLLLLIGLSGAAGGYWWYRLQHQRVQVSFLTPSVSGAEILLRNVLTDETFKTTSPASLALEPGKYSISVSKEGYQVLDRVLEVLANQAGALQQVSLQMEAQIPDNVLVRVDSVPSGASITLDGTETGFTTPAELTMAARNHIVIFTLNGLEPVTQEFDARATREVMGELGRTAARNVAETAPKPNRSAPNATANNRTTTAKPRTTTPPKPTTPQRQWNVRSNPQTPPVVQNPPVHQDPTTPPATRTNPATSPETKPRQSLWDRIKNKIKPDEKPKETTSGEGGN